MSMTRLLPVLFAAALVSVTAVMGLSVQQDRQEQTFPVPAISFEVRGSLVYRAGEAIEIDGRMEEAVWENTEWIDDFVGIEGDSGQPAEYATRVKMLWDDDYLYIGAELDEQHIWATMTERDSPLHRNNAFEIFIDPDGDTHNYIEFQINALGTVNDLYLTEPYRDGGRSIGDWNLLDYKSAVSTDGEINTPQPGGDNKWTLEIALPTHAIQEAAPGRQPESGDQWRINFARAQRYLDVAGNEYQLRTEPDSDRELSPDYWSWAPQGLVNLHYPEMWGYIQFSDHIAGSGTDEFHEDPDAKIKWALRRIYYRMKEFHLNNGFYTDDPSLLDIGHIRVDAFDFAPEIQVTQTLFEAASYSHDREARWFINQSGRIWKE